MFKQTSIMSCTYHYVLPVVNKYSIIQRIELKIEVKETIFRLVIANSKVSQYNSTISVSILKYLHLIKINHGMSMNKFH